jgi:hypothetical protein
MNAPSFILSSGYLPDYRVDSAKFTLKFVKNHAKFIPEDRAVRRVASADFSGRVAKPCFG